MSGVASLGQQPRARQTGPSLLLVLVGLLVRRGLRVARSPREVGPRRVDPIQELLEARDFDLECTLRNRIATYFIRPVLEFQRDADADSGRRALLSQYLALTSGYSGRPIAARAAAAAPSASLTLDSRKSF